MAMREPHLLVSASMMGESLASCAGGSRREMVEIDAQAVEEIRVARIWEPTAPVEPKISAVAMLMKTS